MNKNNATQGELFPMGKKEREICNQIDAVNAKLALNETDELLEEKKFLEKELKNFYETQEKNENLEAKNSQEKIKNLREKTSEKVWKINRPKYEHNVRIGTENYEYDIQFSSESERTLILFFRNAKTQKKPFHFSVALKEIPTPEEVLDYTTNEKNLRIKNENIIIKSIKKEWKFGRNVYLDGQRRRITSFNYFQEFLFHTSKGVQEIFLEIIRQFLLTDHASKNFSED